MVMKMQTGESKPITRQKGTDRAFARRQVSRRSTTPEHEAILAEKKKVGLLKHDIHCIIAGEAAIPMTSSLSVEMILPTPCED